MLDTVVLTIPYNNIASIPYGNKTEPTWILQSTASSYRKFVITETAEQRKDDIYRPRPRLIVRGRQFLLQLEFSVPKLVFGNNVSEVDESMFDEVVKTLQLRLKGFNLGVPSKAIYEAEVSVLHPSKNVVLDRATTASSVIKELDKINLTKKLELSKTKFTNDGESVQFYSKRHSFVIYDKIKDLNKPKARAVDKDQAPKQQSLFDALNDKQKYSDIVRLEVRLSNKAKMKEILRKAGFQGESTFRKIFKKDLCQKIVYMYWQNFITTENLFTFRYTGTPQQVLKRIIATYPEIKTSKALQLLAIQQLVELLRIYMTKK